MARRPDLVCCGVVITVCAALVWHKIEDFLHRDDPCEAKVLLRADWILRNEEEERWSKPGSATREPCNYPRRGAFPDWRKRAPP